MLMEKKEAIVKLEKGLKNGCDIYIGKEKINVFDATLLLSKLKKESYEVF